MKKIIISIGLVLSLCNGVAQNQETSIDEALNNVSQTTVSSGIIYEHTLKKPSIPLIEPVPGEEEEL